ncbi:hypothetical protein [Qipengyuania sp. YIM B01966]|uniref:hypothetical protein n=1 Tax=Qipengyuania sp. YIM B01966 TaxID=2778646 RepID=UPI0018F304A0|nr:hypothetical protein [Qipengyuania sp. YIM B01966]
MKATLPRKVPDNAAPVMRHTGSARQIAGAFLNGPRMTCRLALFALALALPLAALAPPALAAPGDMSVATFLEKANGLKRRGPLALVHADYRLLRSEAGRARVSTGGASPLTARPAARRIPAHRRASRLARTNFSAISKAIPPPSARASPSRRPLPT